MPDVEYGPGPGPRVNDPDARVRERLVCHFSRLASLVFKAYYKCHVNVALRCRARAGFQGFSRRSRENPVAWNQTTPCQCVVLGPASRVNVNVEFSLLNTYILY